MRKRLVARSFVLVVAVVACAAIGCSSSTGPGRSGVAESASLGSISDDDRGKLCDWIASRVGGYGHATNATCDGGVPVRATYVDDRVTCIAQITQSTDCAATVANTEDCILAEVAAGPCSLAEGAPAACGPLKGNGCSGL